MPREGHQIDLYISAVFPPNTANVPVWGLSASPRSHRLALSTPQKTILAIIQGMEGGAANCLLDKLGSGSVDVLTTTSPKGREGL